MAAVGVRVIPPVSAPRVCDCDCDCDKPHLRNDNESDDDDLRRALIDAAANKR